MTDEFNTSEEQEVLQEPTSEAVSEEIAPLPERVIVADIQFRSGSKVYFFDPGELTVKAGDHVIMDTARGHEFGYCTGGNHEVSSQDIVPPLRKILRIATEKDEQINNENIQKEKKAFEVCQQKILEHGLDMQLVSAECAFDGSKIIFFFTADGRVDFRELVKNLASVFRTRIELRQIGVRDKAKMVGGLGICGRPFCCKEFLDDFQPVSIKMAKTQNLSLNPTKISGTCGRLMCCLKYEQDAYEDLLRTAPKAESFVDTPDGRGTVIDVDLLRQRVKVKLEDQPEVVGTYRNEEIAVLRSGKAKKNDPPIPADLAPISGAGRRRKFRELEPEKEVVLDSIKFRYSTETVAEETLPEAPKEEKSQSGNRRRRNRRGKGGAKSEGQKPEQKAAEPKTEQKPKQEQKTPKQEQKPAQKNEGQKQEGQKSSHHRRRRRSHKPSGNASKSE